MLGNSISGSKRVYQLIYASKSAEGFSEEDLIDILKTSRTNNKPKQITGALVYNKGYFLQMLEGEQDAVDTLFNTISQDKRHEKISRFFQGTVDQRTFPDWYMGFFQQDEHQNLDLSNLVNFYDSEHPASQFFIEKLLDVQKKLHQNYHTSNDSYSINEINWIIEEICSPSMRLMFDIVHDAKFAFHTLRLKLGFDHLSVGVIVTDIERNIAYINRSAVNILSNAEEDIRSDLPHFSVNALIGKNIDLFHKNPAHQINILNSLVHTVEHIISLGGRPLSVKTTAITDEFEQRIGYMAEVEDITVKEKNKLDLQDSRGQNQLLNHQVNQMQKLESISRLTSGIAHDFNNILGAIIGYNQLNTFAVDDFQDTNLKEEILFNCDQVGIASQRAVSLINKMMAYSRQNPTNKEIEVRATKDVIDEVMVLMRPGLTSAFKINTHIDCEFDIQMDATALHQILTNLMVNARDAMKQRGGQINVSLTKTKAHKFRCNACVQGLAGEFIELCVSDTGTGIDTKVINHIFDPFFTTKEVGEGTGLGLSTVSGIVHEAQGHIVVDSNTKGPHCGTAFRLLFPVVLY